ncbi:hypothetical protein BRADI_2g39576v3 [Brachypodium distachyon]|uniref:Uncharacterized protein n=1 Tax=Brachypodium distachyon TaxID=15368 RepID=A0A2K2DCW5_BRADI|nr:hypothetical protein BRADI_2g39576v3 [Brachypodium distachyon]
MAELLVSASTGAMGSLLGKLGTMLSDEFKLLKGVRDDISLPIVMADEEKPDPQAKLRVDEVREMSYEIEDSIDKFMLLVDRAPSSMSDGFRKLFSKSMETIKNVKTRHKIGKEVKGIMSQVKEIGDSYTRYLLTQPKNERVDPRLRAIYKDAAELVGVDGPRDELVIGLATRTTTLAKQVYDKLGTNYECRAFVSVSRSPNITMVLSSILSQLRNQDYAHGGDPALIIEQIRNFLQDKRYFIIIDDVWDKQTWQDLNCALVRKDHGSVIIITTRLHDVAKSCCPSDEHLVHKINHLRIFGSEEKCPPNLKEASGEILKKCGGLPLAINAISSLLATGKTEEEWNRVRRSIGFAQGKNYDIDAMNYILSLSYFDLHSIGRVRLVRRWISEGFIHGEDGEDLVELGTTYFYELVNRSLIQPRHIRYDGTASVNCSACAGRTGLGNHHVKDIGRLLQLRYLDICGGKKITELPREIGDLEYLETLDVRVTELHELPESVTRLKRLARLFVLSKVKLPDSIGNMENLQDLRIIDTRVQSVKFLEELGKLTNLRELVICWDDREVDKASCKREKLVSTLCKLDACKLGNLELIFHLREDGGFIGPASFPALRSIRAIKIEHGQVRWFTKWLLSLVNQEELYVLQEVKIEQQDVELVGSIPTLLEFYVNNPSAGPISSSNSGVGFQQLQWLGLCLDVTGLAFEVGTMPNLKELFLRIHGRHYRSAAVGGLDDFRLQHLSNLSYIYVHIDCSGARAADVKTAEVSVEHGRGTPKQSHFANGKDQSPGHVKR